MSKKATSQKKSNNGTTQNQNAKTKKKYISQSEVPGLSIEKALEIPRAIIENYAGEPASPLKVAQALGVTPSSGTFRYLCGTAIAYGLTNGGAYADLIAVEPLAKRILKPTKEGDDSLAKIEAFLKPRITGEFFKKYNGSQIPKDNIAKNVLEEMGVPSNKLDEIFSMMLEVGEGLGLIIDIKGKKFIELQVDVKDLPQKDNEIDDNGDDIIGIEDESAPPPEVGAIKISKDVREEKQTDARHKRVFITHGKNTKFIEPIKKLLSFGEMDAIVSVEKTSISQPVPDKVMNDMRSCGAAIIHVEDEKTLIDTEAKHHTVINSNVLIEIGAAMALFGRRFILLVKDGVQLPSNLQGLFEVRYNGTELDGNATIKLLEAINDIKNQELPN